MDEHELRRAVCEEPTAAGLLRAVLEAPDDDTPRLIYADWLEERGDVDRAEFIRVQVELAKTRQWLWDQCKVCEATPDEDGCINHGKGCYMESEDGGGTSYAEPNTRWQELTKREDELLWKQPTPLRYSQVLLTAAIYPRPSPRPSLRCSSTPDMADPVEVVYRRGFVEGVSLRCEDWLRHGPKLVKAAPLREVTLTDRRPMPFTGIDLTRTPPTHVREWQWQTTEIPLEIFWMLGSGRVLSRKLDMTSFEYGSESRVSSVIHGHAYDSEADALADLSQACLAWARATDVNNG